MTAIFTPTLVGLGDEPDYMCFDESNRYNCELDKSSNYTDRLTPAPD